MNKMGELDVCIKNLIEFNKNHSSLYIYGAGKYAKYALQICNALGIHVTGFITTEYEKDMYCGLPVLIAAQIRETDKRDVGVIPGFIQCSAEVCKGLIGEAPYLDINPRLFGLMRDKLLIRRIVDSSHSEEVSYRNIDHQERILVIRLDAIGDLICTTPLFRAIKEKNDNAELSVIIQKGNVAVLDNNPYIDRIYEYDGNIYDNETGIGIDNVDDVVKAANRFVSDNALSKYYQKVFLPMHFLEGRNAFLSVALSVAIKPISIISWVKSNEWVNKYRKEIAKELSSRIITINSPMHEKDYILTMARGVGIEVSTNKLELYCREEDSYIDQIIKKNDTDQRYVAVGVVGSEGRKTWKSENYKELFADMIDRNIIFVLFGASDAIPAAEIIGESNNVISLVNKTSLDQTIYAIKKCDMYLGSNTGLLHIAVAFDKPCVTLYAASKEASPWDGMGPVRWGAQGVPHIDLLPDHCIDDCRISCSKSFSHCINQITIEKVRNAICSLMAE